MYQLHHAHLSRFGIGSGPRAILVVQRWSQRREASILEILDAAIEIADDGSILGAPLDGSPKSPRSRATNRASRCPGPHQGRE